MLFRSKITSIALVAALAMASGLAVGLPAQASAQASAHASSCSSRGVTPSVSTGTTFGANGLGMRGYFFNVVLVGVKKQCVGSINVVAKTIDGAHVSFKATEKLIYKTLSDQESKASVTVRLYGAAKLADMSPSADVCKPKQMKQFILSYAYGGTVHTSKIDMSTLAICTV